MSEAVKIFVSSDLTTSLTCPECQNVMQTDVSKFMLVKTKVKLNCKCSCGNNFPVTLERRRSERKNISLPGWLTYEDEKYKILVKDISMEGLRIQLFGKIVIEPGITADLEFAINDPMDSIITIEVKVKRLLSTTEAGCEFIGF